MINELYHKILNKEEKISVIGLGYVGLPIAIAFSEKTDVIGFDLDNKKISKYKLGIDPTGEVGNDKMEKTRVEFTSHEAELQKAKFHIVAVPTPVNDDHTPDLTPIKNASKILGQNLKYGSVVVYESTVYPGVTEEICVSILETASRLKCGRDFKVGYSPERINPGDKEHRLSNIVKIVSGMDSETLDFIAKMYELVVDVGIYRAESIKVAEAAKVIENSQRDINIAFMNELSIIFNNFGIDTKSVLAAAKTKWNFLDFSPGLVGGHCIGIDPYYLTYKAQQQGYHSQVILSGRKINDNMGKYIAENLVKNMIKANISIKNAKVAIFGVTFKENCPDIRNTKVIDIIKELKEYDIEILVTDPIAEGDEISVAYGFKFCDVCNVTNMDALVFAVAHDEYKTLKREVINRLFKDLPEQRKVLIDVKGIFNKKEYLDDEYLYWRL